MKKLLITRKIPSIARELLSPHFEISGGDQELPIEPDVLLYEAPEYEVLLTTLVDRVDSAFLDACPNLEVVSNYAVGLDNVDVPAAQAKGVSVYNLPNIVTPSTADCTMALLLSWARQVPQSQQYVRDNRWRSWDPNIFNGEDLSGKTLGLFGFGRVARAVARRARGFDLRVIAFNRSQVELGDGDSDLSFVEMVSWDELLERSDYLSLHTPLTDKTRGIIGMKAFQKMAKRPLILNMARGPVVHTEELLQALDQGLVRGAAIDTPDPEPMSGDHPLCQHPQVLLVPHIGTATVETRTAMAEHAAVNILRHYGF